jgi:tetratricopeptide (TPR) repeat protein
MPVEADGMPQRLAEAAALRDADRLDEARELLLALHEQAPQDPRVSYHLAWTHDRMGHEREAAGWYERAIAGGLEGEELRGALLGLGSTQRCLGEYTKAAETLERGVRDFPEARELEVFLAMALYNLGRPREAVGLLLKHLAETSGDPALQRYRRALLFYADRLDQRW